MEKSIKRNTKVCGIILAAGSGERAGGGKLSKIIKDKPMLQCVVEIAVQSNLDDIILITGYERSLGEKIAAHFNIKSYFNPDYSLGMSTSLKIGVSKIASDISAVLVILGDMPYIKKETLEAIVNLHGTNTDKIIIPTFCGKKGHPVLIPCKYKDEIYSISGDIGAREIIKKHIDEVIYFKTLDLGILQDLDY